MLWKLIFYHNRCPYKWN